MRKALSKLAVVALVLALLAPVMGCSGGQTVKDLICNPPEGVKTLVQTAISVLVGYAAGDVAAANALKTAEAIRDTGCTTVTNLLALIDYLDSDVFNAQAAKSVRGKLKLTRFDTQPLSDWLAQSGK